MANIQSKFKVGQKVTLTANATRQLGAPKKLSTTITSIDIRSNGSNPLLHLADVMTTGKRIDEGWVKLAKRPISLSSIK